MQKLWIVDRSPRRRAAVARLAAAPQSAVIGAPAEPRFESADAPEVVVMGLDPEGDWELELQFAFAGARRAAEARWILLGEAADAERALDRFDTRSAEFLSWPPRADLLRGKIRDARAKGRGPALSERRCRARVAERFARWFDELELPDVLRALDPRLADVPVLIRGEPGTGRSVVARYLHFFGGGDRGALIHLPCHETSSGAGLAQALADATASPAAGAWPAPAAAHLTLWLEELERLPPSAQRTLLDWVETGLPPAAVRAARVRFVATVDEAGAETLDPALRLALTGIPVRLPPLRERPEAVRRIADETLRAWGRDRQERARRLGEDAIAVLEEYPWPGNLRELDAVLVQSLASGSSDPLRADDLQLDGVAFAPLEAAEFAEWVEDAEEETPAPRDEGHDRAADDPPGPSEAEIDALLEGSVEAGDDDRPDPDAGDEEGALAALAHAVSAEVRNPLLTLRTFAELLPERFDDESFRERFAEALHDDVGRMDALVERLGQVAHLSSPAREKVDVTELLESLLDQRRQHIRAQRLLVLKELDTAEPYAVCDPAQLRFALDTLLGKALEWVPTHGDVYLASRHHPKGGVDDGPSVRVLIRFHHPEGGARPVEGGGWLEGSFELVVCEIVIRAQGGRLSITSTDGEETVIVIDLPA